MDDPSTGSHSLTDAFRATPGARAPTVVIGIDAGDPDLLIAGARSGRLPTIASLMARGSWGRTGGREMVVEHGVWTSLFSGMSRAEHGYYHYRQLLPRSYDLKWTVGRDVPAPPFWAALKGTGRRAAIIDAPDTPLVEGIEGIQVIDWAVHNPQGPVLTHPPELLDEISRLFGPRIQVDEEPHADMATDQRKYEQLIQRLRDKGKLCRHVLAGGPFDLVVLCFNEVHTGSHQFWKYREDGGAEKNAPSSLRSAVHNLYVAVDEEIGRVLEQVGQDANVVLLTSVGLEDHFPTDGLAQQLMDVRGYRMRPAPKAGRSWHPISLARSMLPESVRNALSRRMPQSASEALLADKFRNGTDWGRTRAFAIPAQYTTLVYVNLRGRQPEGIVEPGAEYEHLLGELEADFRQLLDPVDHVPAVARVTRTIDLFGPNPPGSLPDLFVTWRSVDRFVAEVVHPEAGTLRQDAPHFLRGSDHTDHGFFVVAGPNVAEAGHCADVSPLEFAPVVLKLLDLVDQQPQAEIQYKITT